jgi:ADP-ribose pyrophosphatase YjhB (NUDIX family)
LPGGALDSHEDSVTAAAREAHEEAGIEPQHLDFKAVFSDDHGNWRYDTVIAHTTTDAGAYEATSDIDAAAGADDASTDAAAPSAADEGAVAEMRPLALCACCLVLSVGL